MEKTNSKKLTKASSAQELLKYITLFHIESSLSLGRILFCCFVGLKRGGTSYAEQKRGFMEPQVFDGHDGAHAALFAKDNLLSFILQDALFSTSVEEAVKKEFVRLDRDFLEACQKDNTLHSGTTALIALLQAR